MKLPEFLESMDSGRRAGLLAGTALLLVAMVGALWWVFAPDYQLLFANLREADAAEVTQSLTEWKVPYRYTDGGTGIEVPADQVYDTRMKLVSAGVPSGGHVGFELFNDADFGVTEFAQRVNYQRALQGELERSIGALPGVQSVRVHLTIRRPGLFVGQDDTSKASVAVTMGPGELLTPQQVGGIRNLVAASVEGLAPTAVVVLGPQGMLSGGGGGGAAGDGLMAQNEEQTNYEARLRERIHELLGQVLKLDDYQVSVDVRMNFDQVKRVSERLVADGPDGNGLLVRRRTSRTGAPAAAEGTAPAPANTQDDFEYAHGTEREETLRATGRVERVSIAVLVPPTVQGAELERLRKLVSAAAGLDSERGDRLEITAVDIEGARATANPVLEANTPLSITSADFPRTPEQVTPALVLGWLAIAAFGLAIGWVLATVLRPSAPKMSAEDREAVLAKMRSWLAEGSTAS